MEKLRFESDTGKASTERAARFQFDRGNGSAEGVDYDPVARELHLRSKVVMNWRAKSPATFDCEYGFSCMGYELSGAWGAAMERASSDPTATVYGFAGDGSFMMLPMESPGTIRSTATKGSRISSM